MEYETFYIVLMSFNLGVTLIIMFAACLCCRKKIPKNEFLGLEGMVKIKNPEENTENIQKIESNSSLTGDIDLKRSSNAPHRSLPDIPVIESVNDNGSELYATVADKVLDKPQGRSPTPSLKKQISVSQHSSISQADDISSPYARVKTPPHDYDKVLSTEHPYAQLNAPGQSKSLISTVENTENIQVSRRESNQSLLNSIESQQEIPAASAIAGMVSASQELPYMTPPIIQQPHFSGDSQDSSKGYTSISVREPLANILAQTTRPTQARLLTRDGNDSHYATVSDDSDEVYAAIDDPNNAYTSGSETYAQIQPSNAITVSVEINTTPQIQEQIEQPRVYEISKPKTTDPTILPPVDTLRAQMHSRQASSSSNTSSIGILSSPKPEKRQANSPLPPTPKNSQLISSSNLTLTSSVPSGRNSVASVIECPMPQLVSGVILSKENITTEIDENSSKFSPSKDIEGMYAKVIKKNKCNNISSQNSSPIMKKKLSVDTNNSPDIKLLSSEINMKEYVLNAIQVSPGKNSIKSATYIDNSYETIDKGRPRCNSYDNKDHGYETIPADKVSENNNNNNNNNNFITNRKSDGYAQITQRKKLFGDEEEWPVRSINFNISKPVELFVANMKTDTLLLSSEPGYESLPDHQQHNINDPGYEILLKTSSTNEKDIKQQTTTNSDYDPNYEVLRPSAAYSGGSDDGYARVVEKVSSNNDDDDMIDGYSRVKERDNESIPGYSKISERKFIGNNGDDDDDESNNISKHHDYASIIEGKNLNKNNVSQYINNNNNNTNKNLIINNNDEEIGSDIYSSISNEVNLKNLDFSEEFHNYQTIYDIKSSSTAKIPPTSTLSNISGCSTKSSEKLTATTTTTPSTGQSSPDNHKYNNLKYSNSSTTNTLSSSIQQHSSSNYESLTGSESDPNYESVRYLNVLENPYERLHNEISNSCSPENPYSNETSNSVIEICSNSKVDISKTTSTAKSITTAAVLKHQQQQNQSTASTNNSFSTNTPNTNITPITITTATTSNDNGEVADYFQV